MLISYKWLSELIEMDLDPSALGERLTLLGLEIDGLHGSGDETVYDIEVTSNRGDCLSHLGVAREIAAYTGKKISRPGTLSDEASESPLVTIEAPSLCPRFTARIVRGVKIAPSPEWLVKKLEYVGERPINNVADITNYVMHELGQPMHAFDLSKLAEERIVVRTARADEKIKTLDEEDRRLDDSMLAICDAERPVAVAGVMGGFESGITGESTDVLLEVACFDPHSIRTTSRKLGLVTEASYRFERGVDIENLVSASNRATELICELAGGDAGEFCDSYPEKRSGVIIDAPELSADLYRLTGIEIGSDEVDRLLSGLGISAVGDGTYHVPTWRHDLSIPEDLVEEAARVHGYEKIGEVVPPSRTAGEYQKDEHRKRRVRRALSEHGFHEAISYSFVDQEDASRFESLAEMRSDKHAPVIIRDPIIEGADLMRPTLLAGLLDSIRLNLNHNIRDVKLFEMGRIFEGASDPTELPDETEGLAIVLTGRELLEGTAASGRDFDFFDLKAAVEIAADSAGIADLKFVPADGIKHLQEGQSASLLVAEAVVGTAGRLRSGIAKQYKFKQPVFVAELDFQALLTEPESATVYEPLVVFPSVVRDISLVIPKRTSLADVFESIRRGSYANFENVSFVDTFESEQLAEDERSMTIRLEYRSPERTLEDKDVDRVHSEVLSMLEKELNATFR